MTRIDCTDLTNWKDRYDNIAYINMRAKHLLQSESCVSSEDNDVITTHQYSRNAGFSSFIFKGDTFEKYVDDTLSSESKCINELLNDGAIIAPASLFTKLIEIVYTTYFKDRVIPIVHVNKYNALSAPTITGSINGHVFTLNLSRFDIALSCLIGFVKTINNDHYELLSHNPKIISGNYFRNSSISNVPVKLSEYLSIHEILRIMDIHNIDNLRLYDSRIRGLYSVVNDGFTYSERVRSIKGLNKLLWKKSQ